MAVGIVVVSHSPALAAAVVDLARRMLPPTSSVTIAVAAGTADGLLGTDATAIVDALTEADAASAGAGTVVLMDLGSAVLSAQAAVDFCDPDVAGRAVLCSAPLVEGLIVAAVAADGGADREQVAAQARGALAAKADQVGDDGSAPGGARTTRAGGDPTPEAAGWQAEGRARLRNRDGLHARPAARFVSVAAGFDGVEAQVGIGGTDTWAAADSMIEIALLAARRGDELAIRARAERPEQATEAVRALVAAIDAGLGEAVELLPGE